MERVKFSSRLPSNRMEPDRNGNLQWRTVGNGVPGCEPLSNQRNCQLAGRTALPVSSDPDCDCLLSPNFWIRIQADCLLGGSDLLQGLRGIYCQAAECALEGRRPNVLPGTVLDKGVISEAHTEFQLISHRDLQGAAQQTFFLWSTNGAWTAQLPLEELENIVNTLSYSPGTYGLRHANCHAGYVLYAAGELNKRGGTITYKVHTGEGHNLPTALVADRWEKS